MLRYFTDIVSLCPVALQSFANCKVLQILSFPQREKVMPNTLPERYILVSACAVIVLPATLVNCLNHFGGIFELCLRLQHGIDEPPGIRFAVSQCK